MTTTHLAPPPLPRQRGRHRKLHPPGPRGAVVAAARWSATHRWTALLLWLGFVAAAVVGGGAVQGRELSGADGAIGASAPADRAIDRSDFGDLPTEQVLVQARDGSVVDPASPALTDLRASLSAVSGVARVAAPQPSSDGRSVLLTVGLGDGSGTAAEQLEAARPVSERVEAAVASAAADAPSLRLEQVGDVTLDTAVSGIYDDDLRRAELLSLPVSLVILVVAFGALVAAGVPLLLALSAVAAAMGLSTLASYLVPSTEVTASVILLVGMAVGVDYSLFYVRREREERARGAGTVDALAIAAATSGRAVVVSGVTVVVAMAGMFLAGDATFSSLAVGTILVVAVSVVGSVTALPAVLALLGRWVDRPRVPLLWRLQRRGGTAGGRFWPAVLRPVLARPAVALAAGVAALAALAVPALGMHLSDPGLDDLPRTVPELRVYDELRTAFPSEGAAHTVAVWSRDGGPLDHRAVDAAVADLQQLTTADGRFTSGGRPVTAEYSEAGDVARVAVPIPYRDDDPRADATLAALRTEIVPATLGAVPAADSAVTGPTAWNVDFRALLSQRMPYVIGFVLLLTMLVLVMSFRSLTVALTAAALNLLSVAAAYGVVVLVFQGSWAEGLLGFTSNGAVVTWLPLFLFVILFGLSMDYHVFVVSRIREGARAGMATRDAVAYGITRSAGVVTSAAAVMVAVFAIFATLTALDFKQLGVGLATAILIDATVVRAVLLPSAMALLGERNWWLPRPLHRLPDLDHA